MEPMKYSPFYCLPNNILSFCESYEIFIVIRHLKFKNESFSFEVSLCLFQSCACDKAEAPEQGRGVFLFLVSVFDLRKYSLLPLFRYRFPFSRAEETYETDNFVIFKSVVRRRLTAYLTIFLFKHPHHVKPKMRRGKGGGDERAPGLKIHVDE